jgi:hypothetical protein
VDVVKFSTTMFQMGNNTGVEVPADAKKPETRTRRIAAVVAQLEG